MDKLLSVSELEKLMLEKEKKFVSNFQQVEGLSDNEIDKLFDDWCEKIGAKGEQSALQCKS